MKKQLFGFVLLLSACTAGAQFTGALVIGPQGSASNPAYTYLPDSVAGTQMQKGGIRFGIVTHLPLAKRLQLQSGVIFSAKGSKHTQLPDVESTGLQSAATDLAVNYIDIPANLLLKLPLKGKTSFLLGAGPQLSLFYNGKYTHNLIDEDSKFRQVVNEDLPVGKEDGQFRTVHFSANALAGFEFGRVFLTAHYAQGLTPFLQKENGAFQFTTLGASLGVHLGKPVVTEPKVKDKDGDGVPDSEDACPTEAGSALTNGCPDTDGDGIADKEDKCKDIAGLKKYGGCPIPDTDGDGLNDEVDRCPTVAGLAKYGGCPMPDKDGDGIADEADACPDKAGPAGNKGCPEVTETIKEKVAYAARHLQFQFQSAVILPESYDELDEVVKILNDHPQLNISIEGHTAGTHNDANQQLSQQRAQTVMQYFIGKGIAAGRLSAVGYGSTRPLVKDAADAANRRVEIKLSE